MTLKRHHWTIPAALAAGCAAAAVTVLIPIAVIENFTASSGLSEIIPQTAPPLGTTARIGIAFVAAVVVAGIVLALIGNGAPAHRGTKEPKSMASISFRRFPRFTGIRRSTIDTPAGENSQGWFARLKSKLDALAGRESGVQAIREFDDLPKLKRADRHPDAPPRPPIRANTDLGEHFDADERAVPAWEQPAQVAASAAPVQEDLPRPVPAAPRLPEGGRPLGAAFMADARDEQSSPAAAEDKPMSDSGVPYADLDLDDLIDRLEARLRTRAERASEKTPVAEEPAIEPEQEERKQPAETEPAAAPPAETEVIEEQAVPEPAPAQPTAQQEEDSLPPLAPRPVQAVPKAQEPQDEMDEALRAALETLERMNRRSA